MRSFKGNLAEEKIFESCLEEGVWLFGLSDADFIKVKFFWCKGEKY